MTKLIALAAAALVGSATFAAADSSFAYQRNLDSSSILDLGTVTADAAGTVEVYDFRGGELGALLGSQTVAAGANSNVRINVNDSPNFDVVAILKIDGRDAAVREYQIAR